MIVLFWNIQRPGRGGFQRFENVLLYVERCLATLAPDLLILCEVPPAAFAELAKLGGEDYGTLAYEHRSGEKQQVFDTSTGLSTKIFTESVCSFFVFYRLHTFGPMEIVVPDAGRFFYKDSGQIQDPFGRIKKITYEKEARPLVLVVGRQACFGFCHLISGKPALAWNQHKGYLQALDAHGGSLLIGDMNVDFPKIPQGTLGPFKAHAPPYLTHGKSILDFIWTRTILWQGVLGVSMEEELRDACFVERDGRLADHAIVGFQLYQPTFGKARAPCFPWPPRMVRTRRSGPAEPDEESDDDDGMPSSSSGVALKDTSLFDFFAPKYQVTRAQQRYMQRHGLEEITIDADGNCLFNALIRMGIKTLTGNPFFSVRAFRDYVATLVLEFEEKVQNVLEALGMTPMELANEIRLKDYAGVVGDSMPVIIASLLGVRITIIQEDGNDDADFGGDVHGHFRLLRFRPQHAPEHYHGTRGGFG